MMTDGLGKSFDDTWDCIVIGAGPAGTMAARHTARAGLKTLLVERRTFPRDKVCGACVNHRAVLALKQSGLSDLVEGLGGVRIDSFMLRGFGGAFQRELPSGVAVSRARLDLALFNAAIDSGASGLTSVKAKVETTHADDPYCTVRLSQVDRSSSAIGPFTQELRAKVVIAADGLGHPSLKSVNGFSETLTADSRIGIGALVEADSGWNQWVESGCIYMAATRDGYGGVVRVENGAVNLAAAIDASLLKSQGSTHAAFSYLLESAGFPPLPSAEFAWRGTPVLSRMINRVAHHRVLVVGDAAGYVEPFTGEGIAWALIGGQAVARSAALFVADQCDQAADTWSQDWSDLIRRRQHWCRRLAWLLRHPRAARFGVKLARRFPGLTNRIVNQLNAELSA